MLRPPSFSTFGGPNRGLLVNRAKLRAKKWHGLFPVCAVSNDSELAAKLVECAKNVLRGQEGEMNALRGNQSLALRRWRDIKEEPEQGL